MIKGKVINTLLTIVSYFSLLFLTMKASLFGIFETVLLAILGVAVIIFKKPQDKNNLITRLSFLVAAFVALYLSFRFYNYWLTSSKVNFVANILHIPIEILVGLTTVVFSTVAVYFIAGVIQQINEIVLYLNREDVFRRDLFIILIASFATVGISQIMIEVPILSMGYFRLFLGVMVVSVFILFIYLIFSEVKFSVILVTLLFVLISTINVYVYSFRDRLLEPVDLLSVATAINVAGNYSLFPVPVFIIIGWLIWVGLIVYIFAVIPKIKNKISVKKRGIVSLNILLNIVLVLVYTNDLKIQHWRKWGAISNGYILNFVLKFKELYIVKPSDYSEEIIDKVAMEFPLELDNSQLEHEYPHIIVIMNESFSDLSVIGEINTNIEVMPFISFLKEGVVSGYVLTSVYGGNTANSEYEFLTGNTMAWLPPNTVPYQQYIKAPTYSMVSYLKSFYDYHCIAMHPYIANGWERPRTYGHLGFDESLFIEDFPQEHFIREYISDLEMYEKIVEIYEKQHQDTLFIFGVSMQNHGAYNYSGDDFKQAIELVGYEREYPDVEQYLSLVHESDIAIEYLISYFENIDEDVLIVFFGDHQPKIDQSFYEDVLNQDFKTLESIQNKYLAPFFIWANYEIEEKYLECTSLNYLSTYLYEAAGIALPPYNQFLSRLEEKIPAINANGFYSHKSQEFLTFEEASETEKLWLKLYEQLQYNNLFDLKNRNNSLFYVLE